MNDKPAIYLTKKHKRYADIYFALLHELAHCKSDFNRAKKGSFIIINNQNEDAYFENKADALAYNWMISDEEYNRLKIGYITSINSSTIVKSFFVYRLAHDGIISYSSKIYQKFNPIIDDLK